MSLKCHLFLNLMPNIIDQISWLSVLRLLFFNSNVIHLAYQFLGRYQISIRCVEIIKMVYRLNFANSSFYHINRFLTYILSHFLNWIDRHKLLAILTESKAYFFQFSLFNYSPRDWLQLLMSQRKFDDLFAKFSK